MSDSICKHVKTLKNCRLQAFPGAGIVDIEYYINKGWIKLNFDVIIIHIGTNDVCKFTIHEFDYWFNRLISIVNSRRSLNSKVIFSAIIPRPLDYDETGYYVISVNSLLRRICQRRDIQFVCTYRPFVKYGMPDCVLFSPLCNLHLNHKGNIKLTNFFVQVLSHA